MKLDAAVCLNADGQLFMSWYRLWFVYFLL